MNINSKRFGEQIGTLVQVWTALNPTRSYSGLSLSEACADLKPSFDVRTRISAAQAELAAAIRERDTVDQTTFKAYKRTLSLIKADPREGEDGQMLKAIYSATRKARRRGVLHRAPVPATELSVVKAAA